MAYKRSSFPEAYDTFIELTDLPSSMASKAQEYQSLKSKSSKTQTEIDRLNQLTTELQNYIISPELFNKLADSITATQKHYVEETSVYVNQLQTETRTYVDTKKTEFDAELNKFTDIGEYNPTTQYRKRNTVTFQGETFLCLQDAINIAPDPLQNTVYWSKIAARGAKGETGERGVDGIGLPFKGEYSSTTQYQVDQCVTYNGSLYASIQPTLGNPPTDTNYWKLAVSKGASTTLTTLKNTVNVAFDTVNVPLGIAAYNSANDALFVYQNSTYIEKGVDYNINPNGTSIDKISGMWTGGNTQLNFVVLKNMLTAVTYQDGAMLQDGSVTLNKLSSDVQGKLAIISNTQPVSPSLNQIWIETGI